MFSVTWIPAFARMTGKITRTDSKAEIQEDYFKLQEHCFGRNSGR